MTMRHLAAIAAFVSAPVLAADCIDQAAAAFQVDPTVLRAIAIVESRIRPEAVRVNPNGSVDRGLFQINSIHLGELANAGIGPADLHDVCLSSNVASLLLSRQMRKFGNTWTAVGAYHSTIPAKRDTYAQKVRQVFEVIRSLGSSGRG